MFKQELLQNVTVRHSSKDKTIHDEWQLRQQTQIAGSVVASSVLPELEVSMQTIP